MKLIDKLEVRESKGEFRLYYPLTFDDGLELSVQASYGHYCSPRKTVELNQYVSMEFALIKPNGDFVTVSEVIEDDNFSEKFKSYHDTMVYGFVPIELIEELYNRLSS